MAHKRFAPRNTGRRSLGGNEIECWTIQRLEVVTVLEGGGVFRADRAHRMPDESLDDANAPLVDKPYDWMIEQMRSRIGSSASIESPIWVYARWRFAKMQQECERAAASHDGHYASDLALLTVVVPRSRVLLSDWQLWWKVRYGWCIGANQTDPRPSVLSEGGTKDQWAEYFLQRNRSWEKIFDPAVWADRSFHTDWDGRYTEPTIQGCMEELRAEDVRQVTLLTNEPRTYAGSLGVAAQRCEVSSVELG